jgi:hypothetical protein
MTVSKVTGVGKNGSKPIARVIYSGRDGQGRDHTAVWVDISDAQSVTGFIEAMKVYKDSLKCRKKITAPTVSVETPTTESSTKPKSQQAIFNGLYSAAEDASKAGKTLTKKAYSDLWEQAGVMHAQSTATCRTKPVLQ